jgi:Ca2+-binding EF-hand superfamily protein
LADKHTKKPIYTFSQKTFNIYDNDKDGQWTITEFKNCLKHLTMESNLDEAYCQQLFEEIAGKGNKTIDF